MFVSRLVVKGFRKYFIRNFTLGVIFLGPLVTQAQVIPISEPVLQEQLRLMQLSGSVDSNLSLSIRPVIQGEPNRLMVDGSARTFYRELLPANESLNLRLLPLSFIQQVNSGQPYYKNDGLMIAAQGYQAYISAGISGKLGPVSIQLKPEFVYAANPDFSSRIEQGTLDRYTNYLISASYGADLPVYYPGRNYTAMTWGQSSVRINAGPVSLGISNESLWWGPGRRNALIMSNNARGFKHISLNTNRPVDIYVGSLEAQIISGRLENSKSPLNEFKNKDWRYLSGMAFTYQPKWIPGLFVGLTRVFQMYNTEIDGIGDYIPIFQPFEKNNTKEDYKNRDQVSSVFARFVMSKAKAELYLEYGRNDHSVDLRDFTMEPDHSRSYIAGFQKLFDLPSHNSSILIAGEVTQLSQSPTRFVREAGTWYVHSINQGYTNEGEVLGASAGPGGNMQTLELSWLKGLDKMGIQFERFVHNNDYYQTISVGSADFQGQWVDLSVGLLYNKQIKNLMISSKLLGIKSWNYYWQSGVNSFPQRNIFSTHFNVGLSYSFN